MPFSRIKTNVHGELYELTKKANELEKQLAKKTERYEAIEREYLKIMR